MTFNIESMNAGMKEHIVDFGKLGGIIVATIGGVTLADGEVLARIFFYGIGAVALAAKLVMMLRGCWNCPKIKG